MISKVQEIQNYLQGHPRREIHVLDKSNNSSLSKNMTFKAITDTGATDLQSYLQKLNALHPQISKFLVEVHQPNGVGRTKLKETLTINWEPDNSTFLGESSSANGAGCDSPASTELLSQNNKSMNTDNPQFPVQNFGMGAAFQQQISLHTKAERYDELKEKNAELIKKIDRLEESHKAKIKKLEGKNDTLYDELREANVRLKTAEEFKKLELLKKDIEKKPFIDPETAKAVLEQAGPVLAAFMQKGQMQQPTAGLTGAENLSAVKKALVEEIYKESFTDDMANNLTNLYMVMLENNPIYNDQLVAIIQQYNNQ